ncbi:MAG: Ig-like domain-containing protein, partial [bacterium]
VWDLPQVYTNDAELRLVASDAFDQEKMDTSPTFKIHTKLYTEIDTPNAGTSWKGGVSDTITWTSPATGVSNYDSFVLEHTDGSGWNDLATVDGSKRKYVWNKPEFHTEQAQVRINSKGASGDAFMDTSSKFIIDSNGPSPSWVDPNDGDTFAGTKRLKVDASDDLNTADTVTFWHGAVGDTKIGTVYDSNSDSVFEKDWNTANVYDGRHDLTAEVYDSVKNVATAKITIAVDTTPESASILNPSDGATVQNYVDFKGTASDTLSPIDKIEFYVDSSKIGTDHDTPFSYSWNTNSYSNGSHTLDITAFDTAGNSKQSSSITVTVDNTDLFSSLDLPNSGDKIQGDRTLYAQWTMQDQYMSDTAGAGGVGTVYFDENFTDSPVVVAHVQDNNDEPVNAQVRTVTSNYATILICGRKGGDNNCPNKYEPPFSVSYIAIEQDAADHPYSDVNLMSGREVCSGGGTWCTFSHPLGSNTGGFVTTVNTNNGGQEHKPTMVRNVDNSNFDMRFCEHDGGDGCDSHSDEEIAYVGFDAEDFDGDGDGVPDGEGAVKTGLSDSTWATVSFTNSYDSPIAFATTNTKNGGNDPIVAETRYVGSDSMQIRICEHEGTSGGSRCDSHGSEDVGWLVMDGTEVNPLDGVEVKTVNNCTIRYTDGSSWQTQVPSVNCYKEYDKTTVPGDNSKTAEVEVNAHDESGNVDRRRSGDFTIDSTRPESFSPITPKDDGCVTEPANVTLEWQSATDPSPASGIDYYQLWVDRPDNFAVYWPLEADDQRNVITGLGFDGEFRDGSALPNWDPGPRSSFTDAALEFDGDPEHVWTEWAVNGDALSGGGAVSMWVYFTEQTSDQQWSGVWDPNGRFYMGESGSFGGGDDATYGYGDAVDHSGSLSTYTWHNITVTFDGRTVKGYEDGSMSGSFNANNIDTNIILGARQGYGGSGYDPTEPSFFFRNGARIGEVQIYRDHLNQNEVQRMATDTLPVLLDSSTTSYNLWDLSDSSDGDTHTWSVLAADKTGLVNGTSKLSFMIDRTDPSQSEVIEPSEGDYIGGNVSLKAHAKDSHCGIGRVEFYGHYEGDPAPKKLGEDKSDSPFRLAWDASSETEGTWDLFVKSYDEGGNLNKSDSVTVEMDNTDPKINVTSPSQGDKIEANTTETITWDATDSGGSGYDSFVIDYREEPTGTWSEVNDVEGDKRSYDWSVPETWADSAAIRVTAKDTAGNTNSDTSGEFLIFLELYVEMLRPDGGEYWKGGDTETLRWEAPARDLSGIEKYDSFVLEYQRDEPYAWNSLTTINDTTQTEYVWDPLPTYDTGEVRVRITANGQSGGSYTDTSGKFWIDSTDPTASWTTPDTGDYVDDKVDLESGSSDGESGLELVRFWHGDVGDTLIQEVGGKSPHKAIWEEEQSPEGWHELTLEAQDRSGNTDTSLISVNNEFEAPVVTITNPASGDAFTNEDVTWSADVNWAAGSTGDTVRFYINN